MQVMLTRDVGFPHFFRTSHCERDRAGTRCEVGPQRFAVTAAATHRFLLLSDNHPRKTDETCKPRCRDTRPELQILDHFWP